MSENAMHGPMYDMSALGFVAGDVITVTGAGSGIGKATALAAAKSGLAVAAWDINREGAEATAREILESGGKAVPVIADVSDLAQVVAAWDATLPLGPSRYLVNNAGPPSNDDSPFADNLGRSLAGVELVTRTWLDAAADQAASVVNIASVAGNFQGGGLTVSPFYASAKAGITGYTRWLATKYCGKPRANVVAPGMTRTPRTIPFMENPAIAETVTRIPMGRPGYPEELAAAILFLLSPAASYINGVLLPVDGGWVLS
jgi:NAD(P)-dependent dehydrogenase (short-subunit alcohol dehydrogenase family)